MDRKSLLLKRRVRYMLILFASFLLVFAAFDVIVYAFAERALFEDIDLKFSEAEAAIERDKNAVESFLGGSNIVYTGDGGYIVTYKIFLLVRGEDGEVLNASHLTAFDYLLNLGFDARAAGKNRTGAVARGNATVYYRTRALEAQTPEGSVCYIQMATDCTDIVNSLHIILSVLWRCTAAALIVVLVVGWYLSKTLTKGIAEAWEKQDEFISYASHELRSPLAVIHNSLELLLERPGDKIIERSELIMNSLTETGRLRKMTSNLLEMAELQASDIVLKAEEFELDELIASFIDPFQCHAELAGKTFKTDLLYGKTLIADRQLITELIVILLENAMKYTEKGARIMVSTREEDSRAVIRVADSGIGIDDDAMQRIFTRFYREERQQSKKDGSGLGLYIAHLIVTRHNGRITAEHNKPKGTVFTVTLPEKRKLQP